MEGVPVSVLLLVFAPPPTPCTTLIGSRRGTRERWGQRKKKCKGGESAELVYWRMGEAEIAHMVEGATWGVS